MSIAHSPGPENGPALTLNNTDDQEAVAAEIRALMGRHRISQARLAAAAGLSSRGMSERLSGKTNFTVRELGKIARFFGKSLGDLFPMFLILAAPIILGTEGEQLELPFDAAPPLLNVVGF